MSMAITGLAAQAHLCQAFAMRRETAIEAIRSHLGELRALGVGSLSLFGSVARDEARPDSDINVLVEIARPSGLVGLMRIRFFLEDVLSTRVDVVTRGGLDAATAVNVMRDAVRVA
jgi:predicted nucleotidyltransferase